LLVTEVLVERLGEAQPVVADRFDHDLPRVVPLGVISATDHTRRTQQADTRDRDADDDVTAPRHRSDHRPSLPGSSGGVLWGWPHG